MRAGCCQRDSFTSDARPTACRFDRYLSQKEPAPTPLATVAIDCNADDAPSLAAAAAKVALRLGCVAPLRRA